MPKLSNLIDDDSPSESPDPLLLPAGDAVLGPRGEQSRPPPFLGKRDRRDNASSQDADSVEEEENNRRRVRRVTAHKKISSSRAAQASVNAPIRDHSGAKTVKMGNLKPPPAAHESKSPDEMSSDITEPDNSSDLSYVPPRGPSRAKPNATNPPTGARRSARQAIPANDLAPGSSVARSSFSPDPNVNFTGGASPRFISGTNLRDDSSVGNTSSRGTASQTGVEEEASIVDRLSQLERSIHDQSTQSTEKSRADASNSDVPHSRSAASIESHESSRDEGGGPDGQYDWVHHRQPDNSPPQISYDSEMDSLFFDSGGGSPRSEHSGGAGALPGSALDLAARVDRIEESVANITRIVADLGEATRSTLAEIRTRLTNIEARVVKADGRADGAPPDPAADHASGRVDFDTQEVNWFETNRMVNEEYTNILRKRPRERDADEQTKALKAFSDFFVKYVGQSRYAIPAGSSLAGAGHIVDGPLTRRIQKERKSPVYSRDPVYYWISPNDADASAAVPGLKITGQHAGEWRFNDKLKGLAQLHVSSPDTDLTLCARWLQIDIESGNVMAPAVGKSAKVLHTIKPPPARQASNRNRADGMGLG